MKKLLFNSLKYSWLILGLWVLSTSIVMLIQAGLGPTPWDVFHLGVSSHVPFSLGQVMIGTGVVFIALSWVLGIKPFTGSILNMMLVGIFVDIMQQWGWFPIVHSLWFKVGYFVPGVVLCGLGTGMYISAKLGSGPRDSMMLALSKISGWRIGIVRTGMEVSVVVIGVLLGGQFGVGTIIFSLSIGWVTEFFLGFFEYLIERPFFKRVKGTLNQPLPQKNIS